MIYLTLIRDFWITFRISTFAFENEGLAQRDPSIHLIMESFCPEGKKHPDSRNTSARNLHRFRKYDVQNNTQRFEEENRPIEMREGEKKACDKYVHFLM